MGGFFCWEEIPEVVNWCGGEGAATCTAAGGGVCGESETYKGASAMSGGEERDYSPAKLSRLFGGAEPRICPCGEH